MVLDSVRYRFEAVKQLGDRTLAQLSDADCHWSPDGEANSIATVVKHLHGNMMSRWTEFLTSDGEKSWRERDGEFESNSDSSKQAVVDMWEDGWRCCLSSLGVLNPGHLSAEVKIRGQSLSVFDAMERQLAHYAYHVGQIVWIGKVRRGGQWTPLSIPRGQSRQYEPPTDGRD
ncbi:MAG: DUF1572 domain-containing protein [bacterium]|nr:DUF1572 domain-containing protein [bacterium]